MAAKLRESSFFDKQQNDALFSQLYVQKQNGMFCDVMMKVSGHEIFAHSALLAAASPYFNTFLNQDMPRNYSQRSPQVCVEFLFIVHFLLFRRLKFWFRFVRFPVWTLFTIHLLSPLPRCVTTLSLAPPYWFITPPPWMSPTPTARQRMTWLLAKHLVTGSSSPAVVAAGSLFHETRWVKNLWDFRAWKLESFLEPWLFFCSLCTKELGKGVFACLSKCDHFSFAFQVIEIQIDGSESSMGYDFAVAAVVDFIYTGKLRVTQDDVSQICEIARIMQIQSVVNFCELFQNGRASARVEVVSASVDEPGEFDFQAHSWKSCTFVDQQKIGKSGLTWLVLSVDTTTVVPKKAEKPKMEIFHWLFIFYSLQWKHDRRQQSKVRSAGFKFNTGDSKLARAWLRSEVE